ncbi:MAG: c-type cytochrome [Geminicoccaceae bacterium]
MIYGILKSAAVIGVTVWSFNQAMAADAAAGRTKAQQCSVCHGIDGIARQPDAPNIGGESAIYLRRQLDAFRAGERSHEQMTVIAQGLSEEDMADIIAWYSSLEVIVTVPN